ncbi:hypothetical protein FRB91_002921 [Serendipita sp. 411]|nr:hypothetical protein FRC18_004430 [Serendipita sp. 400]KAG8854943.1 hypothetical protein FRB91_002921 [Serendipita sp. 411]
MVHVLSKLAVAAFALAGINAAPVPQQGGWNTGGLNTVGLNTVGLNTVGLNTVGFNTPCPPTPGNPPPNGWNVNCSSTPHPRPTNR